jgi:DNA-binding response OmpR family regulator
MGARRKILVVDDEPHIVELLAMNLRQNGYESCSASDGPGAIEKALSERPDLILLDLMLPGMSGLETCRLLRQDQRSSRIPIIMLTAKSEESDKVIGLGIGADDYVTKPFGLRELLARIEVALRHASAGTTTTRILDLEMDEASRRVLRRGEELALSPAEFSLLLLLVRAGGKSVDRESIRRELGIASGESRSLDVHVRKLRMKLGKRADGGEYIATLRGTGYKLDG